MKKMALFILLLVAGLTTALLASQRRTPPATLSGYVEADEIRVGSRIGGRVSIVHVAEGAAVAKGAPMVTLEAFDLRERRLIAEAELSAHRAEFARMQAGFRKEEIAQAKSRHAQLAAQLAELEHGARPREIDAARAQVELAEAESELAERDYARIEALQAGGGSSAGQLDAATSARKVSIARVSASKSALALLEEGTRPEEVDSARARAAEAEEAFKLTESGYRPEDVEQARAAVAAGESTLASIDRQIDELVIAAPTTGVVEAVDLQPGDIVGPNQPALSIIDTGKLWVRAYVPEDYLDLKLDQEVAVTADSFPGENFKGRVTFISRQAEFTPGNVQTPEERSKQVFRIKVTLSEGLDRLRPGMPADVWLDPAKAPR